MDHMNPMGLGTKNNCVGEGWQQFTWPNANPVDRSHSWFFPPVRSNDMQLPQKEDIKYIGLHLDRRLTWHKHIFANRKQLGLTLTKMHWLLGCQSKLSTNNKLLLYKPILKPILIYGIQLWGTASTSNI
jgi:hypothetical protein